LGLKVGDASILFDKLGFQQGKRVSGPASTRFERGRKALTHICPRCGQPEGRCHEIVAYPENI
jgi:hypothetical protein